MNVKPINQFTLTRSDFEARVVALFPLAVVKQFPISTWVYDLDGGVLGGLVWSERKLRGLRVMGLPVGYLHN